MTQLTNKGQINAKKSFFDDGARFPVFLAACSDPGHDHGRDDDHNHDSPDNHNATD